MKPQLTSERYLESKWLRHGHVVFLYFQRKDNYSSTYLLVIVAELATGRLYRPRFGCDTNGWLYEP